MLAACFTVDVTPDQPTVLAGFGGEPRVAAEVASRLEANGVVIPGEHGPVGLVSVDALFASTSFGRRVLDAAAELDGDTTRTLVVVASHTHFAPALDPTKPLLGAVDDDHVEMAARRVGRALAEAGAPRRVHQWTVGRGRCTENVSRRRPLGTLDRLVTRQRVANAPALGIAVVHDVDVVAGWSDGEPRFVVWSWPCHAVNEPDRCAVGADFPGRVRRLVRDRLERPDLPVLYLPGFAGDQRARNVCSVWRHPRAVVAAGFGDAFAPNTASYVDRLGRRAAEAVLSGIDAGRPAEVDDHVMRASVSIPLTDLLSGPDAGTAEMHPVDVELLRSGALRMLFVGAEVCEPYYRLLADVLPDVTMMSGYAGQVFGYLPTDRQVAEGGYEVAGFMAPFSVRGSMRPDVQRVLVDAARQVSA